MLFQCFSRLARKSFGGRQARRVARGNGDIDRRQTVLIQAKGFPREPLDAVARHGGAEGTCRNCQTQSRITFMIAQNRHAEVHVGESPTALPHLAKFGRLVQTLARLERQPLG